MEVLAGFFWSILLIDIIIHVVRHMMDKSKKKLVWAVGLDTPTWNI